MDGTSQGSEQLRVAALQAVAQGINNLRLLLQTGLASIVSVRVGTFASLPSVPFEGMLAGVSDSNTNTWGAAIAGGGSNHVLAYYNGTAWTVAGK